MAQAWLSQSEMFVHESDRLKAERLPLALIPHHLIHGRGATAVHVVLLTAGKEAGKGHSQPSRASQQGKRKDEEPGHRLVVVVVEQR